MPNNNYLEEGVPYYYRCDENDQNFQHLVGLLDADLYDRYGEQMQFFGTYNGVSGIIGAVVALRNDQPAGCGCFKQFADGTVEIKRIFVDANHRKQGIAKEIMRLLEEWAVELGNQRAVLETGSSQPEAIRLYESIGYVRMENYEPYVGVFESICYQKTLA